MITDGMAPTFYSANADTVAKQEQTIELNSDSKTFVILDGEIPIYKDLAVRLHQAGKNVRSFSVCEGLRDKDDPESVETYSRYEQVVLQAAETGDVITFNGQVDTELTRKFHVLGMLTGNFVNAAAINESLEMGLAL